MTYGMYDFWSLCSSVNYVFLYFSLTTAKALPPLISAHVFDFLMRSFVPGHYWGQNTKATNSSVISSLSSPFIYCFGTN